jgi:plastocyanin
MRFLLVSAVVALSAWTLAAPAARADDTTLTLTLKDHRFTPDTVEIAAGTTVKLLVVNADPTPEEFDSDALHREKVIPGGGQGIVVIGPLKPGVYKFEGEYHDDTAQGRVIVK